MFTISSKSKLRVHRLMIPPTDTTGVDICAPAGLTIRQLIHHKRRATMRNTATIIRVEGDHLLCIDNLVKFGYDLCG